MSAPTTLDAALLRDFPLPDHPEEAGKEDRGRLLAIVGSRQLPGAALLAGTAALRAGAGKLQIGTAASIAAQLGLAMPEARVIGHAESEDGCIAEEAIAPLVEWAGAAQAVLVGCGMANGPPLEGLLEALLERCGDLPLVFDAAAFDGLSARADRLRTHRGGSALLPHSGEMARLLDLKREAIEADPGAAARAAAERFGAVALVKGSVSRIASPDGRHFQYRGGGVGLATSGSGDVLAGLVGGLCARGADPLTATLWGVWLHGEAGRILTKKVGRIGFLAREIADLVPGLLAD
jgi:hydroxyethylthiazole kinase-like uncharacterized protein yjeF